jgi:hypothetical protein
MKKNLTEKLSQVRSKVTEKVRSLWDKEPLRRIARTSGFVQRSSSRLQGREFVELMTVEMMQEPHMSYEQMSQRVKELNPKAKISPQGIAQRVNSVGAVEYLKEVLKQVIEQSVKAEVEKLDSALLKPFNRVYLEDSTQGSVHEKLADRFRGSAGSASEASVKIDFIYEVKQGVAEQVSIMEAVVADQVAGESLIERLQPGDLAIRDLGYFKLKGLARIDKEKKGYYLSRLISGVDVYLKEGEEKALLLTRYLNKTYRNEAVIDLKVYVGKEERLPCRLIAYRLPKHVVTERRRKVYKAFKKKGKTPSQAYVQWLAFSFFITNVPADIWSAAVIGTVYRVRWQIELIFKGWKSLLKIQVLKGTRWERILCLIYGRLICAVIIHMLGSWAGWYAKVRHHREISFYKLIKWLLSKGRLAKAIGEDLLPVLLADLARNICRVCKQKRKRLTTQQLLDYQIPYMDSFNVPKLRPLHKLA